MIFYTFTELTFNFHNFQIYSSGPSDFLSISNLYTRSKIFHDPSARSFDLKLVLEYWFVCVYFLFRYKFFIINANKQTIILDNFETLQNQDNDTLKDLLKANIEKPVKMAVYSSKTQSVREVTIIPSHNWGGQGLLGVSIR